MASHNLNNDRFRYRWATNAHLHIKIAGRINTRHTETVKEVDIDIEGFFASLFRYFYRRRKFSQLEHEKPRFKWLPKYRTPVRLPETILAADVPSDELERRLATLGFELSHWTREQVFFMRGKRWGDFSMNYIQLSLAFPFPLASDSEIRIEVADVCLFDTGDLWRLCHEIRDTLAGDRAVSGPNQQLPDK